MNLLWVLATLQDFAASPHGREATSSGLRDWILLGLAIATVVFAFVLCARLLIRPGETDPGHIKRRVLREPPHTEAEFAPERVRS